MKNFSTMLSLIFFLSGNVLISSAHNLLEHDSHHNHENVHCEECVMIQNSNDCDLDSDKVISSDNNFNIFVSNSFETIQYIILQIYFSRAPPIS